MANNMYNKKIIASPLKFILIIPIGMIIAFFLYDFGASIYYKNALEKDTKEILKNTLSRTNLETKEQKEDYIKSEFAKKKYELAQFRIVNTDNGVILFTYSKHLSIVGSLSFGLIRDKEKLETAGYIAKYNEYQELEINKFSDDIEE